MEKKDTALPRTTQAPCQLGITLILTISIVFSGYLFGVNLLITPVQEVEDKSFFPIFGSYDSVRYQQIASKGYNANIGADWDVVFFPLYPLCGSLVSRVFAISAASGLLITSCFCYVLGMYFFYIYLRDCHAYATSEVRNNTFLILALYPTAVFFLSEHSESLFFLLTVLAMYLLHNQRLSFLLPLVIGAATATRPLGIALIIPWFDAEVRRSVSLSNLAIRFLCVTPICLSGILIYMTYLSARFGQPLAFMSAMPGWVPRQADGQEWVMSLLTLRPFWEVYLPESGAYWRDHDSLNSYLFSIQFANPIFFGIACVASIAGFWKSWITRSEVLLCFGLLGIPYFLHSHNSLMQSHARYALVVFPVYIVLARLLEGYTRSITALFFSFSGVYLFIYAALMAAGYKIV